MPLNAATSASMEVQNSALRVGTGKKYLEGQNLDCNQSRIRKS
jgi:hypothetical protein